MRGFVASCFCPPEEKIVNKSCFPSNFKVQTAFTLISRPEKRAELLKIDFKLPFKQLKFSALVA